MQARGSRSASPCTLSLFSCSLQGCPSLYLRLSWFHPGAHLSAGTGGHCSVKRSFASSHIIQLLLTPHAHHLMLLLISLANHELFIHCTSEYSCQDPPSGNLFSTTAITTFAIDTSSNVAVLTVCFPAYPVTGTRPRQLL
jgi:hypothetical protein